MPRYTMKQDWIQFGRDYTVADDDGETAFIIDGHVFAIGDKLTIYDGARNEQAVVSQRLLAWGPTYEVYRGDRHVATVKKSLFTFFSCDFTIDIPGPDDITAEGDFMEHEYCFKRGGSEVAHVSKRWLALRDAYGIDIQSHVDPVLILAGAVVIDLCCHEKRGHGSHGH